MDQNFDHQMSLNKSKCWYSINCLHFLKCINTLACLKIHQYATGHFLSYFTHGKTQLYESSLMQHFDILLLGLGLASPYINRTVHIRHQCMKTTALSCHRCIINTGVYK